MTEPYAHFTSALMTTVRDVVRMSEEPGWREAGLAQLQRSMHIDKVYVEVFRSFEVATREQLESARDVFGLHGIATAAALTTSAATTPEWDFQSLCLSNPEHRSELARVCTLAAEVFDELILDDFFFTNCTCERCRAGMQEFTSGRAPSWQEFRRTQLADAAANLVIGPAKAANPGVRVIVKYPNWYEHFDATGYDLTLGNTVFDGAYTGTETRDQEFTQQHLPQYLSYGIMRYYDRLLPGRNGGGWIDPFQRRDLDRYAEQLRLTLFAKPRELTLFCWGALVDWHTEFDASPTPANWVAPVAGTVLRDADALLAHLGEPVGVAAYRPLRAQGEDYLHHHLGTIGVPVEMRPEFPTVDDAGVLLLTAGAAADAMLVDKMQAYLGAGGHIVMTSGLVRALQGAGQGASGGGVGSGGGLAAITDVRVTDSHTEVTSFFTGTDVFPCAAVSLPHLSFPTNAATPVIHGMRGESGSPLLVRVPYGAGMLHVLAVPEVPTELYRLPREVLAVVRAVMVRGLPVRLEGAGRIGLFVYNNGVCLVHSFLPHPTQAELVFDREDVHAVDARTGASLAAYSRGGTTRVPLQLWPGTYAAVRVEES